MVFHLKRRYICFTLCLFLALRGFRKAFFAFIAALHNVVGSKNMQPIREKYVPLLNVLEMIL
jgi:hypothetical protein